MGFLEGGADGALVVGIAVGLEGLADERLEGLNVGERVGPEGLAVGLVEGMTVGMAVGALEGL